MFIKLFQPDNPPVTLRALLDSGAGASLIAARHTKHYDVNKTENSAWCTVAGNFNTAGKINAIFALPELNPTSKVKFNLHVASTLGTYDVILGRNLLKELGIILDFKEEIVTWNHAHITMKTSDCTTMDSCGISDPTDVEEMIGRLAGDRYRTVLEAKYKKANLKQELGSGYEHLTKIQHKALLHLLTKFEPLFDAL